MDVLIIIYSVLAILAAGAQFLLYKRGTKTKYLIINMLISSVLAFIAFSSFPSNYVIRKLMAIIFGLIGASSLFIKATTDQSLIPKIMLTFSIVASFILLFI